MQFCILTKNHLENVLNLFCECFSTDHYYQQLFAEQNDIRLVMKKEFKDSILFCIEKGISVGAMNDEKLLGFVLLFNYKETKDIQKKSFNKIFGVANSESLPYYEEIHQKIESMEGKTMYLLSIAVHPAYRRCGIASELIDYVLLHYREYNIVSDVSNSNSIEMYRKRGFDVSKIEDEYFFVSRKSETKKRYLN